MRDIPLTDRLTFARPDGGRFQISSESLATMREYTQDALGKPEAGGVLLGRHILATSDIIVDFITTPMPGDRRSRFRFFRARRRHQQVINRLWRESGATCTYLGEWHTHPEPVPLPSIVDRFDWHRKLVVDRFATSLFFVIVGIDEVCVWEGRRHHRLIPLKVLV